MKKTNYILSLLIYFTLFSCESKPEPVDPKAVYKANANALIMQLLKESDCDCLLELPKESLITVSKMEIPSFDMRNFLTRKLDIKSNSTLDSLAHISESFQLDERWFAQQSIKIVTHEEIKALKFSNDHALFEKCKKGIIGVQRPIFDSHYQKAALDNFLVFTCLRTSPTIYEFKAGDWERVEN